MSDASLAFKVICPICNKERIYYDCYDTDNWVDIFCWSGNRHFSHICQGCSQEITGDELYRKKLIVLPDETLRSYKAHFCSKDFKWLLDPKYYWDNGTPDTYLVVERLCSLFPDDEDFRSAYRLIQTVRRFGTKGLTKLEVSSGYVSKEMVLAPQVLSRVFLHDGVSGITESVFADCVNLRDIFLPNSISEIGKDVFARAGLEKCHISNNLKKIPDEAFLECRKLKKLFLPDGLESIGRSAFMGCSSLQAPFFPTGLISIGSMAYKGCHAIKEVTIPASVKKIGESAFADCFPITIKGYKDTEAEHYARREGITFEELK